MKLEVGGIGVSLGDDEQGRLAAWLADLPKPVGVMACNDDHGQQVLDACHRIGLLVPDNVAVVGVDNDENLCQLSNPPLTSIKLDLERIGYEAAALLDRLISGQPPPDTTIEFAPRGIVVRQSSDVLAIEDQEIADAVRFIREHACKGISVGQVVEQLLLSPSTVERRFKKVLGRTLKAEILRVQLNQAKHLLADTNLPLTTVAEKSGFRSINYFAEVFHKRIGTTLGKYRKRSQMFD